MAAYPPDLRARARELWLAGRTTDEAVAEQLGVARKDTIRDWRREEGWDDLKRAVDAATNVRMLREKAAAKAKIDERHDQLAEALEALLVRSIKSGGTPRAGELRAFAAALETAQRVRRRANGMDEEQPAATAAASVRRVVFEIAKPPPATMTAPKTTPAPAKS